MLKTKFKTLVLAAGTAACLTTLPAFAANWLMLQGTEPDASTERAHIWGFIQPTYQTVDGTTLPIGAWAGQNSQFNTHQPVYPADPRFNYNVREFQYVASDFR